MLSNKVQQQLIYFLFPFETTLGLTQLRSEKPTYHFIKNCVEKEDEC